MDESYINKLEEHTLRLVMAKVRNEANLSKCNLKHGQNISGI